MFKQNRTVSAVKRVEFFSDGVSYIVLRGRWCNVIVLNMHPASEEKSEDSKYNFIRKYSRIFFIIFLSTIRKFCQEILLQNWRERIFSNRHLGMRVYIRRVLINCIRIVNVAT